MRPVSLFVLLILGATMLALPAAPASADDEVLADIGFVFDTPVLATSPAGEEDLYVVERAGRVRLVRFDGAGRINEVVTFADIRDQVGTDGEGGLLGLAFSPDFATDGRLWLSYTDTSGDSRIDRYVVDGSGEQIDEGSRTSVLVVNQPNSRHNGGMITFAPDDMLLVGLGDGGGSGDPYENGQDVGTLLGSILRLDVKDRGGDGYGVPSDNPFVGTSGRDEIWVYGLRNPYRFSVDSATGDVWIADVGQNDVEEVNRLPYRPGRAYNLGWNRYEGSRCFESCGGRSGLTFPVHEYGHDEGCSITGGYMIRDEGTPAYSGKYVFGDFCRAWVRLYDPRTDQVTPVAEGLGRVFGFGQDGLGTTYVLTSDRVMRIEGTGTRFTDVVGGSTFADDIERLADAGITRGCNPPANDRFCPDQPVRRQEMAAFIRRAEGLAGAPERFRDVDSSNVFARDIGAIARAGITRGCNPPTNNRFCPREVVTRQEMAAFVRRALDLPGSGERFRDVVSTDVFARDIGAIAKAGITRGCNPPANDRFCPEAVVTREQMAAFLVRGWDL